MSSFPTTLYKTKQDINVYVTANDEDQLDKLKDYFCDKYDGTKKLQEMKTELAIELINESSEEVKENISVQDKIEENKEAPEVKEEEENSVSELNKDYMALGWNELRAYAKELEKNLDVEIIKHGDKKETIQNKIKEVLDGNSKGSDN